MFNDMTLPYVVDKLLTNDYKITVFDNGILFEGKFYNIDNRDVLKSNSSKEFISYDNYMGTNQLNIRSERKLGYLVIPYAVITLLKPIVDKISDIISKAQTVVSDFNAINSNHIEDFSKIKEVTDKIGVVKGALNGDENAAISLIANIIPIPNFEINWVTGVLCIAQLALIILFIVYIFSKKNVYYFAATDKRLAIDKKSLSNNEYYTLACVIEDACKNYKK